MISAADLMESEYQIDEEEIFAVFLVLSDDINKMARITDLPENKACW